MMNQEDLFRKLGMILNELNDQYEYLAQNPQQLNELELELFLANANFLAEHVQIIRKINNGKVMKALPEQTKTSATEAENETIAISENSDQPIAFSMEEENQETAVFFDQQDENGRSEYQQSDRKEEEELNTEIETEPWEKERKEIKIEPIENVKTEIETEPKEEIRSEFEFHLGQKAKVEEPEEDKEVDDYQREVFKMDDSFVESEKDPSDRLVEDEIEKKVTPVAMDHLEDEGRLNTAPGSKPTLNDLLAGSLKKSNLDPDVQKPQLKDLKQAINLNDKLLYIKDLFNGYNLAYAEAIDLINKMPDFKSADDFLKNNYAVKNNWTVKQGTVDKFYELLHQRFTH